MDDNDVRSDIELLQSMVFQNRIYAIIIILTIIFYDFIKNWSAVIPNLIIILMGFFVLNHTFTPVIERNPKARFYLLLGYTLLLILGVVLILFVK